jgi:hypothetical protein
VVLSGIRAPVEVLLGLTTTTSVILQAHSALGDIMKLQVLQVLVGHDQEHLTGGYVAGILIETMPM